MLMTMRAAETHSARPRNNDRAWAGADVACFSVTCGTVADPEMAARHTCLFRRALFIRHFYRSEFYWAKQAHNTLSFRALVPYFTRAMRAQQTSEACNR